MVYDAIRQRQETLLLPWTPLCTIKKNFPRWWWNKLKPMILKDIADMVGLDISTISRVPIVNM
jgi:RNA polymerase sigma-54 factor